MRIPIETLLLLTAGGTLSVTLVIVLTIYAYNARKIIDVMKRKEKDVAYCRSQMEMTVRNMAKDVKAHIDSKDKSVSQHIGE